jgi:hypothetical protein
MAADDPMFEGRGGERMWRQTRPQIHGGEVDLGRLSAGVFVVDAYPTVLDIFGLAHVCLEQDDPAGVYEAELRGTILSDGDSHVLANWVFEVPPAQPGFTAPRGRTQIVPIEDVAVSGDMDMALDVEVNRVRLARQPVFVRRLSFP